VKRGGRKLRKEDVVVYTPRRYYSGDELTEDEMDRNVARMERSVYCEGLKGRCLMI